MDTVMMATRIPFKVTSNGPLLFGCAEKPLEVAQARGVEKYQGLPKKRLGFVETEQGNINRIAEDKKAKKLGSIFRQKKSLR